MRGALTALGSGTAFAQAPTALPAASPHFASQNLPLNLGQLRVTAAQLEGRKRSDAFDLALGPGRDLGIALIDLRVSALELKPKAELNELLPTLLGIATQGLREGTPLHAISLDLVRKLFESPLSQLGVTLMRCSAVDARIEVTTAGMPPVACAHPNGRVTLHGVAAPPLTALSHTPAAVELVPLEWGSTWLATSDGFSAADGPSVVERLAQELELSSVGLALSHESPQVLRDLLTKLAATSARHERDDATLVLCAADPSARLHSGIERRDPTE